MGIQSWNSKLLVPVAVVVTLAGGPVASSTFPPSSLTVVELFTSQGCSSCPPANAVLATLADRTDVLALSFGVTYWDSLGWKDSFARPQFTQRQRDYAKGLGNGNVWTPQMVVDGRADTPGQRLSVVEPFIAAAKARRAGGPQIGLTSRSVTIGEAVGEPATVWLVRFDPRTLNEPIRAGENNGRTLPHRNVVRELTKLGVWTGAERSFALKPAADGLRTAVLVQRGVGGPIIAAAKG